MTTHRRARAAVCVLLLLPLGALGCGFCSDMRLRNDDAWSADWARLEQEMLAALNKRRSEGARCGGQQVEPAPPLVMLPELQRAARHHSLDMEQRNYFDHESLEGCGVANRLAAAGWLAPRLATCGENITMQATVAEAVEQLMRSPGHCANIMSPDHRFVGIGHAGDGMGYWTQDFVVPGADLE